MLAGLEEVNSGRILIGDRDVTDVPPKDRDIAMVFQNYALYPHMTVAENMGFALKIAGVGKDERAARVLEAAKLLDLEDYLTRKPKALSGGQRQRVAMGRAIVRQPQVFLMDEPLSNLDAKLRVQTRTQIASLQRRLGVTTVYVTHDQTEALTMGDRIAVLKDGLLQQVGTPRDLYERPNNVFVAGFIGSPAMNLFPSDLAEGGVQFGSEVVPLDRDTVGRAHGSQVTVGVRPEDIVVGPADGKGLSVVVDLVEELGADGYLYGHTDIDGKRTDIVARVDGRRHPNAGDTVTLAATAGHVHAFDIETGERLNDAPVISGGRSDSPTTRRGWPSGCPRRGFPFTRGPMPDSLSITASSVDPGLLSLPWSTTLAEWPSSTIVFLPKGLSRHLVRFANLSGSRRRRSRRRPRRWPGASTTCSATSTASTCRASSASRSSPGGRMPRASRCPAALVTAHLRFSLPYRALFTQVLRPDTANRLVDALAVLLVRLHNVGLLLGRRVAVEHPLPPRRGGVRRVPRRRRDRRAARERPDPRSARARPRRRAHQHRRRDHGPRSRRAPRGRRGCDRDRRRHRLVVPVAVGGADRSGDVRRQRGVAHHRARAAAQRPRVRHRRDVRSRRRPTARASRSSRRSWMPDITSAGCSD